MNGKSKRSHPKLKNIFKAVHCGTSPTQLSVPDLYPDATPPQATSRCSTAGWVSSPHAPCRSAAPAPLSQHRSQRVSLHDTGQPASRVCLLLVLRYGAPWWSSADILGGSRGFQLGPEEPWRFQWASEGSGGVLPSEIAQDSVQSLMMLEPFWLLGSCSPRTVWFP